MKKTLFGVVTIFLLLGVVACASPTGVEPEVEPAAEIKEVEVVAEVEPVATALPPATPTPVPVATDIPAPRVEPTAEPADNTESTENAEGADEEPVESDSDQAEGDTAEVVEEPFYGRNAEGVFTVGYDSASVKIIDYSDFL